MSTENKTTNHSYQPEPKRPIPLWLIAVVVTLTVAVAVLIIKIIQNTNTINDYREEVTFVEDQKVKLEGELNDIIVTYDSLKTENDSINEQLVAQQEYIKKLLKQKASNVYKIKKYQDELGTLREIMRSYIVQIDSLNTKNKELTEENVQLSQKISKVQTDYHELSKEKEKLDETVALAQTLSTYGIGCEALKERSGRESKPVDKAEKADLIRVCFTVRENKVAKPESKIIFMRIIRPDDFVLAAEEAGLFESEGEMIAYSAKRDLEYDNADIDMCIFWNKTEELIPGTYQVILYAEGYQIGSSTFTLK